MLGVGNEVGGYTIEALLGRGGMGAVYLASHRRLKRRVALKVLVAELAADERFRERFIRESELAASLDHPNVVPIYDADEQEGILFIAMRYVEGSDLGAQLREGGPLPLARAFEIVRQVAGALDAAHDAALVHRDVKPANILIDRSGHVYLSDFGVAKRTTTAGLTRAGSFVGSVDYASPEQLEARPADARADVYSLGCVAYQCLAGEAPFARESEVATIKAHLLDPPPSLAPLYPELAAPLDEAIRTALAKLPEERYQRAGDFASALDLAVRSTQHAPEPKPPSAKPSAGMGAPTTVDQPVAPAPDRVGRTVRAIARHPSLRIGAAVGAVAVAVPALVVFLLSVPGMASLQVALGTRTPLDDPSLGTRLARSVLAPWLVQRSEVGSGYVGHYRYLSLPATAILVVVLAAAAALARRRLPRAGWMRPVALVASAASAATLVAILAETITYTTGEGASAATYSHSGGLYFVIALVETLVVGLFAFGIVGRLRQPVRSAVRAAAVLMLGLYLAAAIAFPVGVIAGGVRHASGADRPVRDLAAAGDWSAGAASAAVPLALGASAGLYTDAQPSPFTHLTADRTRLYTYRPKLAAYTASHQTGRLFGYAGTGGGLWRAIALLTALAVAACFALVSAWLVRRLGAPRAVDGLRHGLLFGGFAVAALIVLSWLSAMRIDTTAQGTVASATWGMRSAGVLQTGVELLILTGLGGLAYAALRPSAYRYSPSRGLRRRRVGTAAGGPESCRRCGMRFAGADDAFCLSCGAPRSS